MRNALVVLIALVGLTTAASIPVQHTAVAYVYMTTSSYDLAVGQTATVTAEALDSNNQPLPTVRVTFGKSDGRGCVTVKSNGDNTATVTGVASDPKFGSTELVEAHVGNVSGAIPFTCIR